MSKRKITKRIVPDHDEDHPWEPELPLPSNEPEDPLSVALRIGTEGTLLKRIKTIDDLLNDTDSLIKVATLTAGGCSISTVEASLGLPPEMLKGWLKNGKADADGPFKVFFQFYLAASAEAKKAAESSLLLKNPGAWLDRIDPMNQLNTEEGDPIQTSNIDNEESKDESMITSESGVKFKKFN